MARRWGYREGDCPVAEEVSGRLLRLPFYNNLTPADQARVVAAIRDFNMDHGLTFLIERQVEESAGL